MKSSQPDFLWKIIQNCFIAHDFITWGSYNSWDLMSQFFIDSVVHHKLCLWGCLWLSNSELISLFPPKQKQKQEKENIKKKKIPPNS